MSHYAKVENKIVINIITAEEDFFETFIDDSPGEWIKTSRNMRGGVYHDPDTGQPAEDQSVIVGDEARERKNFATMGGNYDGIAFSAPQPFPSWTLDNTTYLWTPPTPAPDSPAFWDEEAQQWVLVETE